MEPCIFEQVKSGHTLRNADWLHLRNERGETLLHVAAEHGRLDAVWRLLLECPQLAAVADHRMRLPEHVASLPYAKNACRIVRTHYLVHLTAL